MSSNALAPTKQFPCPKCSRFFASHAALTDHLGSSVHLPKIACSRKNCTRTFIDKQALEQHLASSIHRNDSTPKPTSSVNPSQKIGATASKDQKETATQQVQPSTTKACSPNGTAPPASEQPSDSKALAKPFACSACPRSFKTKSALLHHMNSPSHDDAKTCKGCNTSFDSTEALDQHLGSSIHTAPSIRAAAPIHAPSVAGQKTLANATMSLEGFYSVYKMQGKGELVTLKVTDGVILLVPHDPEAGGNIKALSNLTGRTAKSASASPVPAQISPLLVGLEELPAEPVPFRSRFEQISSSSMERGGGVLIAVDSRSEGYDDCDEVLEYEDIA